ncbi:MAG: hypothetical protein AAF404_17555 [Pseudomonadota bacterium]
MSHSGNIQVTNINVYNESVAEQCHKLGLNPPDVGESIPIQTQKMMKQIRGLAKARFAKSFPSHTLPESNYDSGYVGPLSAVPTDGSAPACVADQITADFHSWLIVTAPEAVDDIARQITDHVVSKGGQPGTFSGTSQLSTSQFLWWSVAWMVVNVSETEKGVLYSFCADWGYEIIT